MLAYTPELDERRAARAALSTEWVNEQTSNPALERVRCVRKRVIYQHSMAGKQMQTHTHANIHEMWEQQRNGEASSQSARESGSSRVHKWMRE